MKAAHSPQPPGALRLVDVDEVGHHAALQQTALRLHPDLRWQQKKSHSATNCVDANGQHAALDAATLSHTLQTHLEDVGGVGQRRGQDAGHNAAEDIDDHGLI